MMWSQRLQTSLSGRANSTDKQHKIKLIRWVSMWLPSRHWWTITEIQYDAPEIGVKLTPCSFYWVSAGWYRRAGPRGYSYLMWPNETQCEMWGLAWPVREFIFFSASQLRCHSWTIDHPGNHVNEVRGFSTGMRQVAAGKKLNVFTQVLIWGTNDILCSTLYFVLLYIHVTATDTFCYQDLINNKLLYNWDDKQREWNWSDAQRVYSYC